MKNFLYDEDNPDFVNEKDQKWWLLHAYKSGYQIWRISGEDVNEFLILKNGEIKADDQSLEGIGVKLNVIRVLENISVVSDYELDKEKILKFNGYW